MTKCRICHCTYERACPVGCSWVGNQDLCSVCAAFIEAVRDYIESANHVSKASLARVYDEATAPRRAKRAAR